MARVNIADWSPDQVAEWLKGLDPVIAKYIHLFLEKGIRGQKILYLRADDLENIGVYPIGHQEIILEAVEHLRNYHYESEHENLQQLAMRVSCAATCLYRLVRAEDTDTHADIGLDTLTLSEIVYVLSTIRPLIYWLDSCGMQTVGVAARRAVLLQLSVEMATSAHLDRFADRPRRTVRAAAQRLAALADYIIQDVSDPVILQPSNLEEVVLRLSPTSQNRTSSTRHPSNCPSRRPDVQVMQTREGASCHRVAAVRFGSPAHTTNIRSGDEIVQIQHCVVVGWTPEAVREKLALSCATTDAALTLRKRPSPPIPTTHIRTMKVANKVTEVPSKETELPDEEQTGSPATPTTPTTPTLPPLNHPLNPALNNITNINNLSTECLRIYFPKPRPLVQRRNTIGGSTLSLSSRSDISHRVEPKSVTFKDLKSESDDQALVRDDNSNSAKKKWRSDKSHSTPAYDFNDDDLPVDSKEPSPLKDYQQPPNDSNAISINGGLNTESTLTDFGETKNPVSGTPTETVNMSLADRRKLFFENTNTVIEFKPVKKTDMKTFKTVESVENVEDKPPEPPPRPLATQSPHMIQVLNTLTKSPVENKMPNFTGRVHTPYIEPPSSKESPVSKMITSISFDAKPAELNHSNTDLSVAKSSLSPAMSLQRLISESKTSLNSSLSPKMSPPQSIGVVRSIFPTGKSRSLKKKNSILAKRRKVSVKDVGPGELQGVLYQRCRTKTNLAVTWCQKWFILTGNTFYGYKSKEATKADCLIFLSGFTVESAPEVKSMQFAFKVYHTGTVFYFAGVDTDSMNLWIEQISRATLLNNDSWERASKKDKKTEESKHFSETDYSDEDAPSMKTGSGKPDHGKEKAMKFGSLKKLANKIHKAESQENVHTSTSLDRKYLGIFSSKSSRNKTYKKLKSSDVPIPTEQYRSYRKMPFQLHNDEGALDNVSLEDSNIAKVMKIDPVDTKCNRKKPPQSRKIPSPINYVHASNPNLLDFEKNDFAIKPTANVAFNKNIVQRPDNFIGFVTLEQFMLNKQEEERRQVYSNRVLMGIERDARNEEKHKNSLQKQLDKIVPDVIYGELPEYNENGLMKVDQIQSRSLPKTPDEVKSERFNTIASLPPVNDKIKDGYEKIDFDDDDKPKKQNAEATTPKSTPRKLSFNSVKDNSDKQATADSAYGRKLSLTEAKELGYEILYDGQMADNDLNVCERLSFIKTSKDVGYETIFDKSESDSKSSVVSLQTEDSVKSEVRRLSDDAKKPKIMPKSKQVLNKQKSIASNPSKRNSSDKLPIFKQGDSPEKFWLDSLRRNDKVFDRTIDSVKSEKFFTKRSEPSTVSKSSEATIVKSERLQIKGGDSSSKLGKGPINSGRTPEKALKSATQYTPMSLPLIASNRVLRASPQFEINLDSRDMAQHSTGGVMSGISRLKLMFTTSPSVSTHSTASSPGTPKEKTLLGSPRLHRAIFKRQQTSHTPSDDFTFTKVYKESAGQTFDDRLGVSPSESLLTISSCDTSNISTMSTPEYPHLQCPPVFEPETYSLVDPPSSRKQ